MTHREPSAPGQGAASAGRRLYFTLMAAAAILWLLVFLIPPSTVNGALNPIYQEDGLVDFLSPLGYVACILMIVLRGGPFFAFNRALLVNFLLLILTLREYDFHTRFTSMSITKLKFYISGEVPLHEKLPAFLVLCVIAWAVLTLVKRHGCGFLDGLKQVDPMWVAIAVGIVLIVLSQAMDGIGRDFRMVGMPLDVFETDRFEALEETLEFGIPIYFFIAALAYFGMKKGGSIEA
jgi:hypothetical protein